MNVAFIFFNRPEHTRKSFEKIRAARPRRLLLIADGPRESVEGEAERCREVRDYVTSNVDWDCEVLTNFSDRNLGCKRRVSSGIDWVFSQVEEAIILEDDCVPHPDFFRFCEEMLERYRDEKSVMHIGGTNFVNTFAPEQIDYKASYYFSRYNHVWGWASWARAWNPHYEVGMESWRDPQTRIRVKESISDPLERLYWSHVFDSTAAGLEDTWDYQWHYAMWKAGGLALIPNVNLITNIGFGEGATHTRAGSSKANLPTQSIVFPLLHPGDLSRNDSLDAVTREMVFGIPRSRGSRMLYRIRKSPGYQFLRALKKTICG